MIKHISKLIFTLAMYELGKYVTEQLLIKYTANDDIDTPPQDFNQFDHIHLNAEVSD
ncbi:MULTISPECIES: transcriptional activator RinB [Staphylococcus]|uniref:transcriptional activator RinB n=1 Tax=Staphylococcus TaxID=1279 RepID=UPI0007362C07|nr:MULTISPECIES: transcriptional regulator [Staphylococcus]KTW08610.1 transcriptional regulator [Staphylococcus warneri]OIS42581.1 transcriptional regulator [Staphylococcus warneri]OIS45256.1 transcriptional regulator [Staphylococcus warneri]QNQ45782.1 transcriptional regulator [Staphylococcus warneri]UGB07361.1 transcriptional activator RinB [Staphylococcus sp. HL28]